MLLNVRTYSTKTNEDNNKLKCPSEILIYFQILGNCFNLTATIYNSDFVFEEDRD